MYIIDDKEIDKIESKDDDKLIRKSLEDCIGRINFFSSFYQKLTDEELFEVYSWFLYSNLLNLYTFACIFKLQKKLNYYNPFYIWAYRFNLMKHFDMYKQLSRNQFEFAFCNKNLTKLKYQNRKETTDLKKIKIYLQLMSEFYNGIMVSSYLTNNKMSMKNVINEWFKIKNFLLFVLEKMPYKNILLDKQSEFHKNKFELRKYYINHKK